MPQEQIRCDHLEGEGTAMPVAGISIGNRRVVIVCEACWSQVEASVMRDVLESATKAAMADAMREQGKR